jgi:hypothetical protein
VSCHIQQQLIHEDGVHGADAIVSNYACLPALQAALLQELRLDARRILINGGQLLIGSLEAPYIGSAVMTLHDRSDTELPIYGTKCIGLRVRSCGSLPDSLLAALRDPAGIAQAGSCLTGVT